MAERTTELRHEIEDTRQRMTGTVDAIGDRVSPGRVAERRWARVRQSTSRARERVMGSSGTSQSSASSGLAGAASSASDAASSVRDGVAQAPDRIEQGTRGNPLAAGAVAFGLGVLVGSLAPATKEEAELADQALEPLQAEAKAIGQQVAESAKDDAQQAVEATKAAATEAAGQVADEAQDGAQRVGDHAQQARDEVGSGPS